MNHHGQEVLALPQNSMYMYMYMYMYIPFTVPYLEFQWLIENCMHMYM